MSTYSLPICGSEESFPVSKIICIGRNYAEHAREMGHDPDQEPPFFFFKPQSALTQNNTDFYYPDYSSQVEYELEFVVAIGKTGKKIPAAHAGDYIFGFAMGLDMTCRDIQKQAKNLGRPWELAKGFDGSAPCTAIQRGALAELEHYGEFSLTRNDYEVQRGNWRDMIWPIAELIAQVSNYITLNAGDLIFTGTPAGMGPVDIGDVLIGRLDGFPEVLSIRITN